MLMVVQLMVRPYWSLKSVDNLEFIIVLIISLWSFLKILVKRPSYCYCRDVEVAPGISFQLLLFRAYLLTTQLKPQPEWNLAEIFMKFEPIIMMFGINVVHATQAEQCMSQIFLFPSHTNMAAVLWIFLQSLTNALTDSHEITFFIKPHNFLKTILLITKLRAWC